MNITPDGVEPTGERLQKVLARSGFGSRRVSEDLITNGRVTVNGEVAVLGRRVDPESDAISVDGVRIPTASSLVYYLLNKPTGVVSTVSDPQKRPTVIGIVPQEPRVVPVGRLDIDTEGLLILTNDGDLTNLLTHPSHGVDKEYVAEVTGAPKPQAIQQLRRGVELEDGMTAPAQVSLLQNLGDRSLLKVVIHEGRNRQVRRMCEQVGHPVVRLVRTRIGSLRDTQLQAGMWRELDNAEVRELYKAASQAAAQDDEVT